LASVGSTYELRETLVRTRIRELRARDGLTQQALADRVEVRRETIVFLEKGRYNPSLALAFRIARVFDLPIEKVFLLDSETVVEH